MSHLAPMDMGKIPLYYSEIGLYISFVCAVFIETVLCGKYRKQGKNVQVSYSRMEMDYCCIVSLADR